MILMRDTSSAFKAHNVWFDEMRFGDTDCTPRTPAEG